MTDQQPGWHPDPAGAHEYRWWDGARWTDDISDGGVAGRDPLPGAAGSADQTSAMHVPGAGPDDPTTAHLPTTDAAAGAAPAWDPAGGTGATPSNGKKPLLIGVGVLAVVALVAAAVILLTGDDGDDELVSDDRRNEEQDDDADGTADPTRPPTGPLGDLDDLELDLDDFDLDDFDFDLDGSTGSTGSADFDDFDDFDFDTSDLVGSVAEIYEDLLGLSSVQARCLAEALLGADGNDVVDPDDFGAAFGAFEECGIDPMSLGG